MAVEPTPVIEPIAKPQGAWKLPVLLGWSFAYSLIGSLIKFASQTRLVQGGAQSPWSIGITVAFQVLSLGFLFLMVSEDKSWARKVGLDFKWRDPLIAGFLVIVCMAAMFPLRLLFAQLPHDPMQPTSADWARSRYFSSGWTPILALFLVVNPFFEELIVRAFFMSELKRFSWPLWLTVFASAAFQASYHLYQGWQNAMLTFVMFLCLSIYFGMTNRIAPIILTHMAFDFLGAWQVLLR